MLCWGSAVVGLQQRGEDFRPAGKSAGARRQGHVKSWSRAPRTARGASASPGLPQLQLRSSIGISTVGGAQTASPRRPQYQRISSARPAITRRATAYYLGQVSFDKRDHESGLKSRLQPNPLVLDTQPNPFEGTNHARCKSGSQSVRRPCRHLPTVDTTKCCQNVPSVETGKYGFAHWKH